MKKAILFIIALTAASVGFCATAAPSDCAPSAQKASGKSKGKGKSKKPAGPKKPRGKKKPAPAPDAPAT